MAFSEVGSGSQRATKDAAGEDSSGQAFAGDVTAGNLLVCVGAAWNAGGAPTVTVSDSRSSFWTVFSGVPTGMTWRLFIAYALAASSGACTVTVNPSNASDTFSFSINEFQVAGGNTIAVSVDGGQTEELGATSSPYIDTITTTTDDQLVISVFSHDVDTQDLSAAGATTLFGSQEDNSGNQCHAAGFQIAGAAGSQTATFDDEEITTGIRAVRTLSFREVTAAAEPTFGYGHGAIQWSSGDAVGYPYVAAGLTFQPKLIRLYWVGIASAVDASSTTTHMRRGGGFATSTTNRHCVATFDEDAAGTTNCGGGAHSAACVATVDGSGAFTGLLDLYAITEDGFTLIVDDVAPASITVFWEAWGGTDITNAETIMFAEPATDVAVDYVLSGAFQPDCVMFFGCQSVQAAGTAEATDSGWMAGFSTGTDDDENIVIAGNSDDGSGTTDTDRYATTSQCVAMIALAGGDPSAEAKLTAFNADGFELTWDRSTTDRKYIALAVKGGSWQAGSLAGLAAGTVTDTATVSGLTFTPVGISAISNGSVIDTPGSSVTRDLLTLASGTSTTSRRSMYSDSATGVGDAAITLAVEYDQFLFNANATLLVDISAMNSDGFTLIVDDAAGSAFDLFVGYLTFGAAPAAGTSIVPVLLSQYRRRWGNL